MPIAGKLEVVVKFNALPTEPTTNKDGGKTFVIAAQRGARRSIRSRSG